MNTEIYPIHRIYTYIHIYTHDFLPHQQMAMLVAPPQWPNLKCLNNCFVEFPLNIVFCVVLWCPEDEP